MLFFISLIFNMAAIAPSITWPLFLPYIADYFIADTSGSSVELQAENLLILSLVVASVIDPLVAYILRKVGCLWVVVFGYSLLIGSTVVSMFVDNLQGFVVVQGTMG